MEHELVKLAQAMDWCLLEEKNNRYYAQEERPGISSRLMIGLPILKYMYNLSEEGVCERCVYDPYFQYFCGEMYFWHKLTMERTSMTHGRKSVGE